MSQHGTTTQIANVLADITVAAGTAIQEFEINAIINALKNKREKLAWLLGLVCRAMLDGSELVLQQLGLLQIDRSKPFDPAAFLGDKEWKIDEQDEASLALTEVDSNQVRFITTLEGAEKSIKGERKLERLKEAGHIRLDAKVFQTLWENKHLIPESWKEKTNGNITFIFFDGTVLRGPGGDRCVLCLCWDDGLWYWDYRWLGRDFNDYIPSAVLASTQN